MFTIYIRKFVTISAWKVCTVLIVHVDPVSLKGDRTVWTTSRAYRSTESTKVESIDGVDRFFTRIGRFVRLDRFQDLVVARVSYNRLKMS